MNVSRLSKPMTALLFIAGTFTTTPSLRAESFHSGGAGNCSGCHVLHTPPSGPVQMLLQASDPSSICLNCHTGPGGPDSSSIFSPDGSAMTPGGDFYWLTRTYSWVGGQSPGSSHGHNIVARDFNLVPDPVHQQAPGGTYPAARLGCTSCHDPHGRVAGGTAKGSKAVSGSGSYGDIIPPGSTLGNYRMLGDSDYTGGSSTLTYSFVNDAPVATQNTGGRFSESDGSHVAYGSGMSEWCVNCHTSFAGGQHHKAGNDIPLTSQIISNYNAYLRTGDLSGIASTAYLQFVPFEQGKTDPSQLNPTSSQGPDSNANVMCLSCHRAHASAFASSGRWDFTAQLLAQSHPALGDSGATATDVTFSYYGRDISLEFGSNQGQFCEKCHGVQSP